MGFGGKKIGQKNLYGCATKINSVFIRYGTQFVKIWRSFSIRKSSDHKI
jgi:hypothetical protein